ncbi:MAG: HD domain-containing protein [Caryophanon sp.]|nr:HD domain-containing protein [Caryophanon sp.]
MVQYKDQKLHEEKVFKDPVHSYVHVRDQVIWDLISTREFQRLRRIRQLGTTFLVFHGAEHTRFNHSLGVYELMRRVVDDRFQGRDEWDDNERLVVLCAALLHDLGHGPFSHAFENVFQLDHEQYTRAILLGDTEVNAVLRKVSEDFPLKVSQVIEKTYPNRLVVSLISSQIDVDRMDYLQRDAFYTGVTYGHFDLERILRVLRPYKEHAVIKLSGMHAVEDYIMSRYQMYLQVYFHPVSRSAEAILNHILQRAKHLYMSNYDFDIEPRPFVPFFTNNITLEDYICLDESILFTYFQLWMNERDEVLRDLCTRFVNRRLFKYSNLNSEDDVERYGKLQQLFAQVGIDPMYYLVADSTSDDFYRPASTKNPIMILMPDGTLQELSTVSPIVDAVAGKMKVDRKIYYPLDVIEALEDEALRDEILTLLHRK